ncbi:DUF3313 domain-containing protein [Salmonella enterica]|nr:DUF3313 domain-containing protein [Salmonella enterica]EJR3519437.1 DUF3313 domain-containing protein [Salmonella enterica]
MKTTGAADRKLRYIVRPVAGMIIALALSACTGKYTEQERYSGFLKNYGQLKQEKSASGIPVLRWVSPDFNASNYDAVYIMPVTFWPDVPVSEQAQKEKLQTILNYTNTRLERGLRSRVPVADKPGPRTLTLRAAITAVDVKKQGLSVWEVMPVPALIAGTQYLTGYRTLDVTFYFEAEVTDSLTHKPLITAVRRSQSATLSNSHKQLTVEEAEETISELISDFKLYGKSEGAEKKAAVVSGGAERPR